MCDLPALSFQAGTLQLQLPPSVTDWSTGPVPWTWDHRTSSWRVDAMWYRVAASVLRQQFPALHNTVPAWRRLRWPTNQIATLRAEQLSAVDAWLSDRRGVIVMPTGSGKTEVALELMRRTAVSTLIVSPIRDLMYQWHRRILEGLGYDSGIVGDGRRRVRPVSVTTYDSACLHMARLGNHFALVIFDECHHLPGRVRSDAARMSAAPFRMGLTATLERADGRHLQLSSLIGPIVYDLPLEAIRGRSLADYEIVRIPVRLSPDEQRRYDYCSKRLRQFVAFCRRTEPRFDWKQLCYRSATNPAARQALVDFRVKRAIENRAQEKLRVLEDIFKLHVGSPIIVFAGSNAMARAASERFLVPCLLSHHRKKERHNVLQGLANGTFPAIVANRVLDEGVDVPAIKVAVVMGGGTSTRQARQRLGRILRKDGNARAVLYEVICGETNDMQRSRRRMNDDAFQGTCHRRL